MKVKLLKNKMENGKLKTTIRMSKKKVIGWFEGTILEVGDPTGEKLIANGEAELYVEPTKAGA